MYGEGRLIPPDRPFQPVSFVIPAHNEAKYLRATIHCLQVAIADLSLNAEIIVVDDASTDETAEIATAQGATVIPVQLRNIGAVRNAGAAAAKHRWLIFVDADTLVPSATIEASLRNLSRGDSGGGARVTIPNAESLFFLKRWMFYAVVLVWQIMGRWAAGCYMVCRKDLFEEFGGFDENYFAAEEAPLPAGTYSLNLRAGTHTFTQKIVVQ